MRLAHVRRGTGPPLALIHGIGSQWQMWEPVLDRVAREREVVALDLPGFGDSEERRARPTVEALATAAAEFLDGLGFAGAHVAGNSLGGGVALQLARMGVVRSACGISPAGFVNGREGRYARTVLMESRRLAKLTAARSRSGTCAPGRGGCRRARRPARCATSRARRASVTLTGCGHVPTWDEPDQVARVLLEASADGVRGSAAEHQRLVG
jgi:pimeloyl-ACP methyl ester carboxylesterase